MVLEMKYEILISASILVLKTRMDDKRSFEHTYLSQPVVLEIKGQPFTLVYI